jgi:subtilisin family serine protease
MASVPPAPEPSPSYPRSAPRGEGKLHPRLRMFANGDTEVQAHRAEHCSSLKVGADVAERFRARRGENDAALSLSDAPDGATPPPPMKTTEATAAATVSVFVQLKDESEPGPLEGRLKAQRGNVVVAELPLAEAQALRGEPEIAHVELGQPLAIPRPLEHPDVKEVPDPALRSFGAFNVHKGGAGVLIGVIDVGGFDFAHPDFLTADKTRTRFISIWDQGGKLQPPPADNYEADVFKVFDYGAELTDRHLNEAINAANEAPPERRLPATDLEPQSAMVPGSHATHVTSIAAGNSGLCRDADIAAVLISIPEDDSERRQSFYDSTRIADAVDYLLAVADKRNQPIAINISLGTNGHAHDDSAPINRWIDAALTRSGRCVCVAAGNAGQERAENAQDIGWIMGRVHASGQVRARELVSDIEWTVVGNGTVDISENELEIWYGPQDRFSVQVRPPDGEWSVPVEAGQYVENQQLPDGSFLSIYNELYHPANGANLIAIYLSPRLKEPVVGVTAGEWLVRLRGDDVRDGRYHCWIERDDPRPLGRLGDRQAWAFPSFFSEASYIDRSTVSTLACAQRVVSVANLDQEKRRINITSSQGPTRDDREKPDIAAPGTRIVAANGFVGAKKPWVAKSGTSMASPYITGLAGLMLAINRNLTAAQIGGILRRTARPLPASDFTWRDDAGAGEVDPERCLREAAIVGHRLKIG